MTLEEPCADRKHVFQAVLPENRAPLSEDEKALSSIGQEDDDATPCEMNGCAAMSKIVIEGGCALAHDVLLR
jgi:hypothetical protein